MLTAWLTHLIVKAASELEAERKTIFQFTQAIEKGLKEKPVQDWEADRWARGLNQRLIRMEGHFFRIGQGKRSTLSFFIRNDQGLLVGLRRESVTQAATYVSLVTDYGYGRQATRFETQWMDVAVYGEGNKALIYAENKATTKLLDKLCGRLEKEFASGVPFPQGDEAPSDDALMKAQHIWLHKPQYFWAVAPTLHKSYRVNMRAGGFTLEPVAKLPSALEWEGERLDSL